MKGCSNICSNTQSGNHVPKLRYRRICQHSFDIILCHSNGGGKYSGKSTNNGHQHHWSSQTAMFTASLKEWEHADDHIDTCGDHGCCMDHCRYWCWTFHGIW